MSARSEGVAMTYSDMGGTLMPPQVSRLGVRSTVHRLKTNMFVSMHGADFKREGRGERGGKTSFSALSATSAFKRFGIGDPTRVNLQTAIFILCRAPLIECGRDAWRDARGPRERRTHIR